MGLRFFLQSIPSSTLSISRSLIVIGRPSKVALSLRTTIPGIAEYSLHGCRQRCHVRASLDRWVLQACGLSADVCHRPLRFPLRVLHGRRHAVSAPQRVLTLEEIYNWPKLRGVGHPQDPPHGRRTADPSGVVQLCEKIAALPGLRELCMTTNGSQLGKLAAPLFEAGVKRLNISLDSLDPQRFRELTRTGDLAQVINGIDAANAAGFRTPNSIAW